MDLWLLLIATLLAVLGDSEAQQEGSKCIKANAQTCGECIQVAETCGWCTDENFFNLGKLNSARCDDLDSLKNRGCAVTKIENPRGHTRIDKNKSVTNRTKDIAEKLMPAEITQIQPQKLTLTLRSGEPQTFALKFKHAEDYPIDLYYLMDLSSSMTDDLENIKNLGTNLMREMQEITSDFRIGLGFFVKKNVINPCAGNQNCTTLFSYKNILKLTKRGSKFNRLVRQQISGSLDSTEGDLDAIMQMAVSEDHIGWRDVTRLLVFSTDASFHLDYPSIAHSFKKLSDHNIQTIFAVTEEVQPVYKELKKRIPKSAVGTLSSNSSNVIKLILDAFNSLSSEVILKNSRLPEGVSITYKSICKNSVVGTGENGRKCSNISIGDEVSFEISIESKKCPSHGKPETIMIKPLGFTEEVEIVLNFICDCECSKGGEPNSEKCHEGNGTFECGACKCNEERVGQFCECSIYDVWTEDPDASCRRDDGQDICSNNGDCVCGSCECKKRYNPAERYSGKYCECDNFNCDRSNNKLCGGHGRCECRMCICDANYTGSACDCSLETSTCLAANGQICNGRGSCNCGICKCTNPKFQGPTCEICPTCPGVCTEHKECVQCQAFGTGEKKDTCERDCSYFRLIKVQDRGKLPEPYDYSIPLSHCKERDANDCWFYFSYAIRDNTKEVHVVETLECPEERDIFSIVPWWRHWRETIDN